MAVYKVKYQRTSHAIWGLCFAGMELLRAGSSLFPIIVACRRISTQADAASATRWPAIPWPRPPGKDAESLRRSPLQRPLEPTPGSVMDIEVFAKQSPTAPVERHRRGRHPCTCLVVGGPSGSHICG